MTILWLIFVVFNLISNDFGEWTAYTWLGISVMYIAIYSFDYFNQYLTIQNNVIKENHLFGKKINLNEIKRIKKFAGDYILQTDKTELTINTQIIDQNSLTELNAELEKLNVEWT
ncbi:hypothetical protein [uncultured Algibacter sp.]|uniref:hypothetical protein n=1 Tax=uncultured Algibacter sp. TaxID=298659 RepID=UPI0025D6FB4E|nr:hypothetical protein [uncultured Algibacter sp.]